MRNHWILLYYTLDRLLGEISVMLNNRLQYKTVLNFRSLFRNISIPRSHVLHDCGAKPLLQLCSNFIYWKPLGSFFKTIPLSYTEIHHILMLIQIGKFPKMSTKMTQSLEIVLYGNAHLIGFLEGDHSGLRY